ncbi:MAG: ImmA/IrrE family metallo-endopeptidase [Lachnospiraceae bacterium]|jgi:Zn-dependent peptidase ImmA (M78 family)|nr:ImmA/IrrE family metallo-endopeptidase [Lachnospiraceae bacterium]
MDSGKVFEDLIHLAASREITVKFAPLRVSYARIQGNRIALSDKLETIEDFNYNLAHELAHSYLHGDKGDIIPGAVDEEMLAQYEEQADRGAKMLLDALAVRQKGSAA